jgi:hypothetical protein
LWRHPRRQYFIDAGSVSLTVDYMIVFLTAVLCETPSGFSMSNERKPEPQFNLPLSAGHLPVAGLARERHKK